MDLDEAREFLRDNHRAVMATRRADGTTQMSPVAVGLDAEGRVTVSTREAARKVAHLRRDPRVAFCVMPDGFFGAWIQVEGRAVVVPLPEALEGLVDQYRSVAGEHPDWDEFRQAMRDQRRVLLRVDIDRAGPDRSG